MQPTCNIKIDAALARKQPNFERKAILAIMEVAYFFYRKKYSFDHNGYNILVILKKRSFGHNGGSLRLVSKQTQFWSKWKQHTIDIKRKVVLAIMDGAYL